MIVSAAVLLVLVLAVLAVAGSSRLDVSTYEVLLPRLPRAFDGYGIVQISDLHQQRFGRNQSRLLSRVQEANPDLIVITGDLTSQGSWDPAALGELARRLVSVSPVFMTTGNHEAYATDLPELLSFLQALGVTILDGTSVVVHRGTDAISVAGVADPRVFGGQDRGRAAMAKWRSALQAVRKRTEGEHVTILLSHRPEFLGDYSEAGFDLVLSGHAHGGQVRLPFIGALYAPGQGWFPRCASGVCKQGGTTMVVSRGLGNSRFPIRLFNSPELVVIRLRGPVSPPVSG